MDKIHINLQIGTDNVKCISSEYKDELTELIYRFNKNKNLDMLNINIDIEEDGTITMTNDGNGIDKVFSPNLDEIFDLGVTTTDGSGLGLHHVRQVVNEMGGSITVDAEYSDGAKFIIRFAR